MAVDSHPAIKEINDFWFPTDTDLISRWFAPNPALDASIKSTFEPLMTSAAQTPSPLDTWTIAPNGTLALLLLLDQFPRNVYRNSPRAYASDAKASSVAVKAIAAGQDREVGLLEQIFFYLPLMHDETVLGQVAALGCCEGLVTRSEEGSLERNYAEKTLESTRKHLRVIERFGRFPSRNAVLGRESTGEEMVFLEENKAGF
jgi:uncharacterized protein (DUF924 family)